MSESGGAVDAVVVGTGPNGLAAALVLAGAGLAVRLYEAAPTIGGGARTAELTLPGFRHDVCSAAHPMAMASPFFRSFDLARHGVRMLQPEIAYAHPLDTGTAGLAWPDLTRTAEGLGADGARWSTLFGPLVEDWHGLVQDALSDLRHFPASPSTATRFALRVLGASVPPRRTRLRTPEAAALLAGVSAHAIGPPSRPVPAAVGLLLAGLAHAVGWPVPYGGSQSIVDAMALELTRRGAQIVTGHRVRSLAELPPARAVLLDVSPAGLLALAGDRLRPRHVRRLRRFRYGPGVCKVDFALSDPVPWAAPGCDRAGTLHLIGSREEAETAELEVAAGRHAERPFVLAVQPGVVDDTRAPGGSHTLYTYAHVPHASPLDVSGAVIAQVERFAPGFRELILAHNAVPAASAQRYNDNYVGGDISGGALTLKQLLLRPRTAWDPYSTPIPGVYMCSAATPPGPGVHGMCGVHAARRALKREFGRSVPYPAGYTESSPKRDHHRALSTPGEGCEAWRRKR
ncbi:NAD(P)/FAD-dependent oxidoreductase [Spirillospora sp. NBC_00431]